jgi:hypothetical protein
MSISKLESNHRSTPRPHMVFNSNNNLSNFIIKKMEWLKTNFKQTLLIGLIMAVLSVVGTVVANRISARDTTVSKSASVDYVDTKCTDTRTYIDKQDNLLNERIGRVQESLKDKADQSDYDKLYQKTEENNKLLFEVLKEIKGLK